MKEFFLSTSGQRRPVATLKAGAKLKGYERGMDRLKKTAKRKATDISQSEENIAEEIWSKLNKNTESKNKTEIRRKNIIMYNKQIWNEKEIVN